MVSLCAVSLRLSQAKTLAALVAALAIAAVAAAQAIAAGLGPDAMPAVTPHNGTVTAMELVR